MTDETSAARLAVKKLRTWPAMLAVLSVATLAALALVAPAAQAAPAWLPQKNLSPLGRYASHPDVAVDPLGNAVAVWRQSDGSDLIVHAATRPAGAEWSEPQRLSDAGQSADSAELAVGPQGSAVALWTRSDGDNAIVQAATRPAGGEWSEPQNLSAAGEHARNHHVALDGPGNAVAVWTRSDGSNAIVEAATRPAEGGWSEPQRLSAAGERADSAEVAVDPQGNAVAVWTGFGTNPTVQAASRPAGGGWSQPPQNLSAAGQPASNPHVALDAVGNAVAVWQRRESNPVNVGDRIEGKQIVQASIRPAREGWSDAQDISSAAVTTESPQVALDPLGNAVAVWNTVTTTEARGVRLRVGVVQAATRLAGVQSSWREAENLSGVAGNADSPQVALDPLGNAVAIWRRYEGRNGIIEGATRRGDDGWEGPQPISEPQALPGAAVGAREIAESPQLALDGQGNAVTAWFRYDGLDDQDASIVDNFVVQAAGYDAAGPQLRGLKIPGAGTAGSPVSFSVAALDVWSRVASTSWSFGDGSGADGSNVSHSYARPGSYEVTVTATDTLGNVSSARHTVQIRSPSAGRGTGGGSTSPKPRRAPSVAERSALRSCLQKARRAGTRAKRLAARRRCLMPGRPRRVRARASSGSEIVLSFLAPASAGRSGPPARRYVVKQSTRPITSERSFRSAFTLCGRSCRLAPTRIGQRLTLKITGLRAHTTYYYAVKAVGAARRAGPRSKSVRARTR